MAEEKEFTAEQLKDAILLFDAKAKNARSMMQYWEEEAKAMERKAWAIETRLSCDYGEAAPEPSEDWLELSETEPDHEMIARMVKK